MKNEESLEDLDQEQPVEPFRLKSILLLFLSCSLMGILCVQLIFPAIGLEQVINRRVEQTLCWAQERLLTPPRERTTSPQYLHDGTKISDGGSVWMETTPCWFTPLGIDWPTLQAEQNKMWTMSEPSHGGQQNEE